jgi:translation initiation factor 5B
VFQVNGKLQVGDKIMLCGINGPVQTQIRSLLVPKPLEEIRVNDNHLSSVKEIVG